LASSFKIMCLPGPSHSLAVCFQGTKSAPLS